MTDFQPRDLLRFSLRLDPLPLTIEQIEQWKRAALKSTTQFGFGKSNFITKETSTAPMPNADLKSTPATQTPLTVRENRHAQTTSQTKSA